MLDSKSLAKFIKRYTKVFPDESKPTLELVEFCRFASDYSIESQYNLMYVKETKKELEIVAHWCMANKDSRFITNVKALREVLNYTRKQNKPVIIDDLNENYFKSTKPYGPSKREF